MLDIGPPILTRRILMISLPQKLECLVVCHARGPRPRFPRVWKTRKRIGTISKSQKLVNSVKELSNVKEEVYGALDSFIAWELEFPLIVVKKALKTLEFQQEWKRIIQVIKWMLSKGQGQTMGTYYTLLNALAEDGRLEEAEEFWTKIFSRYLESLPRIFYTKMISLYYKKGLNEKMLEVFADMEELGVKPEPVAIRMVGNALQKLGMHDKYEKLHKKYPPPKWEYRYFKGKRVKVRSKHLPSPDDVMAEIEISVEQFTDAEDKKAGHAIGLMQLSAPHETKIEPGIQASPYETSNDDEDSDTAVGSMQISGEEEESEPTVLEECS